MIEENRVHGFTHLIIASESKGQVAYATTYMNSWQVVLNPLTRPNEISSISIVLIHTCSYGKHVRVNYDVAWFKPYILCKQFISPLRYIYSPFKRCGLSLFVEAHHHNSCSMLLDVRGTFQKHLFPLFERYGIDNTLSLDTFKSS